MRKINNPFAPKIKKPKIRVPSVPSFPTNERPPVRKTVSSKRKLTFGKK